MPDQTLYEQLKQKVQELSDNFDNLQFSFWKKTGSAPSGITGTDLESTNFSTGVSGWRLDADGNLEANNGNFRGDITGASGTFSGTVTVASLNIPDTTTANSMHVDSSGNAWWGTNVATGYATALAKILATGVATFKNAVIGSWNINTTSIYTGTEDHSGYTANAGDLTLYSDGTDASIHAFNWYIDTSGNLVARSPQIGGSNITYTVGDNGIFSFGDGSDGAGVANGSGALAGAGLVGSTYTLTRDVYYTDLTVSTGVTIKPAGYRIFGTGTLTLNGTAIIERNGNAGTSTSNSTGGAGATALADGYLKGSLAGGRGADSGDSGGTAGGNTTNSIGSSGSAGGGGGNGASGGGGSGKAGGTATASNVSLIANWHLATLLDVSSTGSTVKFDNSGSGGGGGCGGVGDGAGGGGGGGGGPGGIIAIYFRAIVIGASASITANGGNGGNGANAASLHAGGGGGGGGGNGGQIILVYNSLTNSGTLTASAGVGGTKGTGNPTGVDGTNGTNGSAGTVRSFSISM